MINQSEPNMLRVCILAVAKQCDLTSAITIITICYWIVKTVRWFKIMWPCG